MKLGHRFTEDNFLGVHFALNVFLSTMITWGVLKLFTHANPIWAMAAMVAASEPRVSKGMTALRSRLVNTLVGCAVGLAMLSFGEPNPWKLPFALAVAVLLSAYVVRVPMMWRQAPITAAIIIAGSLSEHARVSGLELGVKRVAEVVFGCCVALAVSWVTGKLWPVVDAPDPPPPTGKA